VKGTITVRNTALKPWTADNFDLSFEYYTADGGVFSAGVFRKEIRNFFGTSVRLATAETLAELGLDPRYVGWNLNTKFNSGDARITGGWSSSAGEASSAGRSSRRAVTRSPPGSRRASRRSMPRSSGRRKPDRCRSRQ
jgi:outer membrane receptor protein involved in Fe transport